MRKKVKKNKRYAKVHSLLKQKVVRVPVALEHLAAGDGSVEIYKSELDYLLRLISESPDIETGGQLFGFRKDDGTAVVLYAIGAGPKALHQTAFFVQDTGYLLNVGGELTGRYGLEHIGEWHSHHRLGLTHPSGHDAGTIRINMGRYGMNRCLLCIGTVVGSRPRIDAYGFCSGTNNISELKWKVKMCESPFRSVIGSEEDILNSIKL